MQANTVLLIDRNRSLSPFHGKIEMSSFWNHNTLRNSSYTVQPSGGKNEFYFVFKNMISLICVF